MDMGFYESVALRFSEPGVLEAAVFDRVIRRIKVVIRAIETTQNIDHVAFENRRYLREGPEQAAIGIGAGTPAEKTRDAAVLGFGKR